MGDKMTNIQVLAPKELKSRLQRLADRNNRSLSSYVRLLLQELIDQLESENERQRH